MQEYSQRQAGITWAIVLCILIPIVLAIVFLAMRQLRRKSESNVEYRGAEPNLTKHTQMSSFREPVESDKLNE
ncbi:hypothetical protein RUM44_007785 [Polyplax serrata]|uniref:Uncharacterized protein n=1 Tax=Polyplax serrata TaxID=468196 RepID=A0ABR1BAH5_POLSC